MFNLYEMDWSCSPGGVNAIWVYDESRQLCFIGETMDKALDFVQMLKVPYEIHTLEQYHVSTL